MNFIKIFLFLTFLSFQNLMAKGSECSYFLMPYIEVDKEHPIAALFNKQQYGGFQAYADWIKFNDPNSLVRFSADAAPQFYVFDRYYQFMGGHKTNNYAYYWDDRYFINPVNIGALAIATAINTGDNKALALIFDEWIKDPRVDFNHPSNKSAIVAALVFAKSESNLYFVEKMFERNPDALLMNTMVLLALEHVQPNFNFFYDSNMIDPLLYDLLSFFNKNKMLTKKYLRSILDIVKQLPDARRRTAVKTINYFLSL